MNNKRKATKNQVKNKVSTSVPLSNEAIDQIVAGLEKNLRAWTWRDLETHGKFRKNDKLSFIDDETLIVGCDVGSEEHYVRAIDSRGRELSRAAFAFKNTSEGFTNAKAWAMDLAARNKKTRIVLGLEPTGHYWFCLTAWMVNNGISVVQVNPYAVKQTKELEDNSQNKNDLKDPKSIANLVKDGNYGMPYLPEDVYAEIRRLSTLRDQLTEDRIRYVNRLHREMTIYFPEYKDAFGKIDGIFTLTVLKEAPFPEDILALGEDGIRNLWKEAGLKGCGYRQASTIQSFAEGSVGLKQGVSSGKMAVQFFAEEIIRLKEKLKEIEAKLSGKCKEIPHAEKLQEIGGIGKDILPGILAEIGDISRFDDAREIQKLAGLSLVACSSGKHKGETRISRRGRKRLRYWLFLAARSTVIHSEEFRQIHEYYTKRPENPLKKLQSLMAIAAKLLRIIFTILKTGAKYDSSKMLKDIRRLSPDGNQAA